jgi:hypothetical protein
MDIRNGVSTVRRVPWVTPHRIYRQRPAGGIKDSLIGSSMVAPLDVTVAISLQGDALRRPRVGLSIEICYYKT